MMFDPEIEAIAKTYDLFKVLEDDSKIRVIQWLVSKFSLNHQPNFKNHSDESRPKEDIEVKVISSNSENDVVNSETFVAVPETVVEENLVESYETVAEFFATASPNTEWEKALVVASYLQVKNSLSNFSGFEVNKELKNLGHASSNITDALTGCMNRKPQYILQLRKEGKSAQAKKKYKVSTEGLKYVKTMLSK